MKLSQKYLIWVEKNFIKFRRNKFKKINKKYFYDVCLILFTSGSSGKKRCDANK